VFFLLTAVTRISAIGSMIAVTSMPFSFWFFGKDPTTILVSAAISLFVIFLHRDNIKRMIDGTENKVFSRKK
jgi:glycerol-3-phosphate acyltransferase PlsY